MCGLCGLVGPAAQSNDLKALRQLIYVCALRGTDGTGFATVSSGIRGEIRVWKDAVPSAYAIWKDAQNKRPLLTSLLPSLYMAHCRDATIGKVNTNNTHPFRAGGLVGMHNGTLRDSKYLGKDKTDSELMFIDMADRGIKTVLDDLDANSAFAISVYDKKTQTVNFARSDVNKRPLYFATHPKRKILFYSSEKEMLELCLTRCNILYKIHEARPGILYSINPNDIEAGDKLPFTETPLDLRTSSKHNYNWGSWGAYENNSISEDIPWVDDALSDEAKNFEKNIPAFLQKKSSSIFHGCTFCREALSQSEQYHCETYPEPDGNGGTEIVYMCTDCRAMYDGVATTSEKRSSM